MIAGDGDAEADGRVGYDYPTRQVARNDAVGPARTPLADYYNEKGEAPGVTGHLPAVNLGYKLIRVRISDLDKLFPAIPTTHPEDRYRRW